MGCVPTTGPHNTKVLPTATVGGAQSGYSRRRSGGGDKLHVRCKVAGNIELHIRAASKFSKSNPSTNVPIQCEQCGVKPAKCYYWKHAMVSHVKENHKDVDITTTLATNWGFTEEEKDGIGKYQLGSNKRGKDSKTLSSGTKQLKFFTKGIFPPPSDTEPWVPKEVDTQLNDGAVLPEGFVIDIEATNMDTKDIPTGTSGSPPPFPATGPCVPGLRHLRSVPGEFPWFQSMYKAAPGSCALFDVYDVQGDGHCGFYVYQQGMSMSKGGGVVAPILEFRQGLRTYVEQNHKLISQMGYFQNHNLEAGWKWAAFLDLVYKDGSVASTECISEHWITERVFVVLVLKYQISFVIFGSHPADNIFICWNGYTTEVITGAAFSAAVSSFNPDKCIYSLYVNNNHYVWLKNKE